MLVARLWQGPCGPSCLLCKKRLCIDVFCAAACRGAGQFGVLRQPEKGVEMFEKEVFDRRTGHRGAFAGRRWFRPRNRAAPVPQRAIGSVNRLWQSAAGLTAQRWRRGSANRLWQGAVGLTARRWRRGSANRLWQSAARLAAQRWRRGSANRLWQSAARLAAQRWRRGSANRLWQSAAGMTARQTKTRRTPRPLDGNCYDYNTKPAAKTGETHEFFQAKLRGTPPKNRKHIPPPRSRNGRRRFLICRGGACPARRHILAARNFANCDG